MSTARYFAGAEGRCFLYAKEATFRCPYAEELSWGPDDAKPMPLTLELEALIAQAEVPVYAERLMKKAHGRNTTLRHADEPDTCNSCGARLVKVGYRTWIEATIDDPIHEDSINDSTRRLNSAFGATHLHVRGSTRYWPTKREAITWAREEAAIDKQAKRDEVQS